MLIGLEAVLSEESINLHKEHLKNLKLKYSILEKSIPEISGKSFREISKMRIKYRDEVLSLLRNIKAHEIYFDSFGREFKSSNAVRNKFRTESAFLYELYEASKKEAGDFLLVTLNKDEVEYELMSENSFLKTEPLLAIDLCEHAYFLDFGFEKEEYLKRIISRLNLNRLDKKISKRD